MKTFSLKCQSCGSDKKALFRVVVFGHVKRLCNDCYIAALRVQSVMK